MGKEDRKFKDTAAIQWIHTGCLPLKQKNLHDLNLLEHHKSKHEVLRFTHDL